MRVKFSVKQICGENHQVNSLEDGNTKITERREHMKCSKEIYQ